MNITYNITTTTELVDSGPPRLSYSQQEKDILKELFFWVLGVYLTIICIIGLLTNLLNILLLSRSLTQNLYKIFLGMAVVDFLLTAIFISYTSTHTLSRPARLTHHGPPYLKGPYSLHIWNKNWFFIANFCFCVSNWCAALLSIFRLIIVVFPLRASILAGSRRVTVAVVCVYVCGFLIQIPSWFQQSYDEYGSVVVREHSMLRLVSLVANGPLPYAVCVISTILLGIQLARGRKEIAATVPQDVLKRRENEQHKLTATLLLVVITFITLNTPNMIYSAIEETGGFVKYNMSGFQRNLFYVIQLACTVTSYCINFFIYALSSPPLRRDLMTSITRTTAKRRKDKLSKSSSNAKSNPTSTTNSQLLPTSTTVCNNNRIAHTSISHV